MGDGAETRDPETETSGREETGNDRRRCRPLSSLLNRLRWPVLAAVFVATTVLFALRFHSYHNTLNQHPTWHSSKVDLEKAVLGAVAYVYTPFALLGERLNLGGFWGFQEVLYGEPVEVTDVSFGFDVPSGSYFSFVYGRSKNGFSGVRISRTADFSSLWFRADADGGFVETVPLPDASIAQAMVFRASFIDSSVKFTVDDRPLHSAPHGVTGPHQIGFRGGPNDAYIDDIQIVTPGRTIHEEFDNPGSVVDTVAAVIWRLLLVGACFVAVALGWRLLRVALRRPQHTDFVTFLFINLMRITVLAFIVSLLIHGIGLVASMERPPAGDTVPWGFVRHFGSIMYFDSLEEKGAIPPDRNPTHDTIRAEVKRRCDASPPQGHDRILFIGSSQTFGAGASSDRAHWVARVGADLNGRGNRPVEIINAGISGNSAEIVTEHYLADCIQFAEQVREIDVQGKPRLVVVDLGSTDRIPESFGAALERLAAANREHEIPTLFLLEATDPYSPNPNADMAAMHEVMRKVGAEFEIPTLDVHSYLLERKNRGFLWWDFVHPTDFGHRLMAEAVTAEIRRILNR